MKKEINKSLGQLKIKKSSALFAPLIAAMIGCFAPPAQAAVQATLFDPPLRISISAEVPTNESFDILGTDFNADGVADFRLAYGFGGIEAYFNAPTRFAKRTPQTNLATGNPVVGGPVGAVPLNSRIGTNIVSPGTNIFAWSPGYTNNYDITQSLGDHEASVIAAYLISTQPPLTFPMPPTILFSSNGIVVTNAFIFDPLPSLGDVLDREAVMAIEFNISGERHYGYIHFDLRGGIGAGVIYGWAYETEPNVAIKAKPLSTNRTRVHQPPATPILPGRRPSITAQPNHAGD